MGFLLAGEINPDLLSIFTVHFKGFFHFFKYFRILTESAPHFHFIKGLAFIADPVFHCCPEIHGYGAELDFHGIILHPFHVVDRDAEDEVIAAVAVGLRSIYVIFFFNDYQIGLLFQTADKVPYITFKKADHANARYIMQGCFCIIRACTRTFLFQLLFDTGFIFDTAADPVNGTHFFLLAGLMVQDFQPGEDQADSIGIRMDQLVVLFFCHLYHTPFNNID